MPDTPTHDGSHPPLIEVGRFRIGAKTWDTEFFGRSIGALSWGSAPTRSLLGPSELDDLRRVSELADRAGYSLVECHVDLADFDIVSPLEEVGFRLVDSRIQFLTRWSIDDIPSTLPAVGSIRTAVRTDRDRIVELTHESFTDNERFTSRFKNPDYFSEELTRRYFETWIDSTAFDDDAASAMLEVTGEIVGYYVYQVRGEHEGLPIVKGILTAVSPEHRGGHGQLAMQAFLYRELGLSEWYLDNTTQLTNVPVIRNHIRSSKHLEQIVLTFYRQGQT